MGEEKRTIMVLKVDLQCSCCYKKVKRLLCKFPQIRDQVFDEKTNTVTIVVICCSPEKIRDKLCYKGGKAIKSIDIKDEPSKPKGPEKPKADDKPKETEKPTVVEKPKELEKPKAPENEKPKVAEKPKEAEKPKVAEKPKEAEKQKVTFIEAEKPKSNGKGDKPKTDDKPAAEKPPKADQPPKQPDPAPKPSNPPPQPGIVKTSDPVNGYPLQVYPPPFQVASYCGQCYDGYGGGPCYHGFGRPVPPPPGPYYDGYGYGGNNVGYVARYDYLSEENQSGCSIM